MNTTTIVPGGVQSGAGVIKTHGVVDQVSKYPQVVTPMNQVRATKVDGTYRRRFGNVKVHYNDAFNYPTGAPGVYAQSRIGSEGYGNMGEGAYTGISSRDSEFKPAADLLEAQGIVNREVTYDERIAKTPSVYGDMTRHEIKEKIEDINIEFQEKRIRGLYEKGFSEAEISGLIQKEREKAIEKAQKIDSVPNLEAIMPLPKGEISTPGAIPLKKDLSSYERSTGIGGRIARDKKYQAIRTEQRISSSVNVVEPPREERESVDVLDLVKRIGSQRASEKSKMEALNEDARREQRAVAATERATETAMESAVRKMREGMPRAGAGGAGEGTSATFAAEPSREDYLSLMKERRRQRRAVKESFGQEGTPSTGESGFTSIASSVEKAMKNGYF